MVPLTQMTTHQMYSMSFDSNYKKKLCLTQELLDIIYSPSIGEELVTEFQSVFYAVRYSWAPIDIKKDKHGTIK